MSWLSHRMIRNETLLSMSMFSSRKFIVSNCNLRKRIQGQQWVGGGGGLGCDRLCSKKQHNMPCPGGGGHGH